ncbi:MAG: hypothetical protein Q4B15_05785 [Lachnospiraceae bacterium]|nr:hypothetical protein [Lachnospiraceae bacterium]
MKMKTAAMSLSMILILSSCGSSGRVFQAIGAAEEKISAGEAVPGAGSISAGETESGNVPSIEKEPERLESEGRTPDDAGIDLKNMGLTDVRGQSYSTYFYLYDEYPRIMALDFQDAVTGLDLVDLDRDGTEELLAVTYTETWSDREYGDGSPMASVNFFIYEQENGWIQSGKESVLVDEMRSSNELRFDVFLDQDGNIFLETYEEASRLADGMEYTLRKFVYEDGTISEQTISTETRYERTGLQTGGSDYMHYLCLQLDREEVDAADYLMEEDREYITRFIDDYKALGFTGTDNLELRRGTMDQNENVRKICRIELVDHVDDERFFSQYSIGYSTIEDCGTLDFVMTDYQNVKTANSGVARQEGRPLAEADSTGQGAGDISAESDVEKIYEEILQDIGEHVINGIKTDDYGLSEIIGSYGSDAREQVGYTFMDLNDDGTEELLIISADNGESRILYCYTAVDQKPVELFEGWSRNRYYLLDDGYLLNEGSGGAAYGIFSTFRIASDGTLVYRDCYFWEPDLSESSTEEKHIFYYNTTGSWEVSESREVTDMTDEEIWEIRTEYEKHIVKDVELRFF